MPTYNFLSLNNSSEWIKQFCVASLYALLLYIGDVYFESDGLIGHFEPASGLALAILLIGGKRYVLGIFCGAATIHVISGDPLWQVLAISSSDTLQAYCGFWLLGRADKFDQRLHSLRDFLQLILLGGGISIGIGAWAVNTELLLLGMFSAEHYVQNLFQWWMSDTLGVVLITPLILVWWRCKYSVNRNEARRVAEAVMLLGLTILAGQVVFLDWLKDVLAATANGYWMFMLITWVSMFLGVRGTTIALLVVAVQALFGATHGIGYFADDIQQANLLNYWFYMLTLSLVGMSLATYVHEIKEANFAVAHRDALIREIHHRIKNNIQGITGLLRQLAENHPNTREAINQTIGQVQSIATIHGLQERTAVEDIELGELAGALAKGVGSLWGNTLHVAVPAGWKPYIVDAAEAVPLALILNELLSNALKHGEGLVTFALEYGQAPDSVHVIIRNAGLLSTDFDFERDTGTGLQLVKSLMPREGARISWQHQDNAVITLLELESPVITSGHES